MQDIRVASRNWHRYAWVRDNGHAKYVEKHDKCERFFCGDQWDPRDRAALLAVHRPALTINKIISTISNLMGEQIYNRAEIAFQPASGANPKTAAVITKLFKNIAERNQLDWKRSDMFADGVIGSRGFLDVRMNFNESMQGDVEITKLNPKNVLIDPDADDYDPDTWKEVIITKWLTADDIGIYYSEADAKLLRAKQQSVFPFGYDSMDTWRDRFGGKGTYADSMYGFDGFEEVTRNIRVIERQFRKMDKQLHFVYPKTGETRPIPESWEEARINYVATEFGLKVIKKLVSRIRWTVTAEDVVLHDDWSPYKHFTVIPYFPYLRHGNTIGVVENLIDPQELLNKSESQNLHIINTSANSGWIVKRGSLTNMDPEDLEERGAETGLVIEVAGDTTKDITKITPNSVPTGHDRLAFKAEDHIDKISGVNESMKGEDRSDVSSKAIQSKKQSGKTNIVKPMDALTRTDFILARNVLDLIQEFYTEERIEYVTKDRVTGEAEEVSMNQFSPETGEIVNDLTLGEYKIVITSVPARETLEDSEFEQLVVLRTEVGITAIKDEHIIAASRLRNKMEIIQAMQAEKDSAEAQRQAELKARADEAAVAKEEGEAKAKHEDAGLRRAKADQLRAETANPEGGTPGLDVEEVAAEQGREDVKANADITRKDTESQQKVINMAREQQRKEQEGQQRLQIEAQQAAEAKAEERVNRMTKPTESA